MTPFERDQPLGPMGAMTRCSTALCMAVLILVSSDMVRRASASVSSIVFDIIPYLTGGTKVSNDDVPVWFAVVKANLVDGTSTFCGGGLLTPTHVLTAAHCVNSELITQITVYSNGANSVRYLWPMYSETRITQPNDWWVHPDYDSSSFTNDVAIGTMPSAFGVTTSELPTLNTLPSRCVISHPKL